MTRAMPLYLMIKPPFAERQALLGCVNAHAIDGRYGAEKYHCTMLKLGESQAWSDDMLDRFCGWMALFDAEPFRVSLDQLDGNLLRESRRQAAPAAFQRALARFVARLGFPLPVHNFWLHLTLAYRGGSGRRAAIVPISWLVDEILLVRSVHGVGHDELARWQLRKRQLELPFHRREHTGCSKN